MATKSSGSQNFGDFFREKRLLAGYSLRSFCKEFDYDPGNISKIERALLAPPLSREKLEGFAGNLGIKTGSEDWSLFMDLASVAQGKIPKEVIENEAAVSMLPVIFRTLKGDKPDREKLKELEKIIMGD
jgi:transcriptional regulator with XRE-family HTH domain